MTGSWQGGFQGDVRITNTGTAALTGWSLAWQFAGESSGPLPQWRCLKLDNVSDARPREGRWHEGGSHRTTQTCVSAIDLDINVHVRKRR